MLIRQDRMSDIGRKNRESKSQVLQIGNAHPLQKKKRKKCATRQTGV
jgi:hypothetical protein